MVRRFFTSLAAPAAAIIFGFAGCGGGIADSLTGGSVPTGGRAVTGTALLPNAQPAANAQVQITALPSNAVIATTTTNAQGQFTVSGVPSTSDVDVVISVPPGNVLEAVVPQFQLSGGGSGTVNIGTIDATTSIVAAAIKLEQMNAPQDAGSIIGNQIPQLTNEVDSNHYSQQMQQQFIGNRNNINTQALTLMTPAANSELMAMNQNPNSNTASAALNGVLGYLRAAHSRDFQLNQGTKQELIIAQIAGKQYTAAVIAQNLQEAGIPNATSDAVLAAADRETQQLTALNKNSNGEIPPFEALVIAADVSSNGGFQCNQQSLNAFLSALVMN